MIHFLFSALFVQSTPLKLKDIAFQTENHLKIVVGARTSNPHEPGIRFFHRGYNQVWVDTAGPKMKRIILDLSSRPTWKQYVGMCGLNGAHSTATPEPSPASFMPLERNKMLVKGVTGLPVPPAHSIWTVTFKEYAVANHERLRALRSQIMAAPVGDSRNRLIQSCYDWWSELEFQLK